MKEWKAKYLIIHNGEQKYIRPQFDDFMEWLAKVDNSPSV